MIGQSPFPDPPGIVPFLMETTQKVPQKWLWYLAGQANTEMGQQKSSRFPDCFCNNQLMLSTL